MTDLPSLSAALADRYRLDRQLGAGGMATVYLAYDDKHGRDVAIKVLRPDLAESLGRDRFLREIRLAARLNHPHILPLYDSGEAGGFLYFVMPVMQGQTLRERLGTGARMPVDEAIRIASEVADALDYAHRQDIVHRDIKPENILLHEGHAVVADFGIGKALVAASQATAAFTQIGVTVGTPAYMSPEQAAGDEIDGRSDLFALGCVMYEMLTGEVAFTGPTVQAVIAKRFLYSPPTVSNVRTDIPAVVADTVARLLEKSATDRVTSGAHVVAALRNLSLSSGERAIVTGSHTASTVQSVAVLPFTNLSADADNEYFSDGLTEELITDLSTVKALHVISRTSSMQLKGTTKGMREIGRDLDVRYVLTGGVRKAGQALRITAQLIDTQTDAQLWADKYSGTMDDVFDVQERVSRAIVSALRVTLSVSEDARLAERPIRDARAFELYLQVRQLVRRYGASMDHANALLDRAIEIEGESPPLRAMRAYMWIGQVRSGMSSDLQLLDRAEREARALVDIAPNAPYGYSLLGFIGYERGQLRDVERYLTLALERDATDGDAWFFRGISLQGAGQKEAAIAVGRGFLEADPLSPMAAILWNAAHWFVGQPFEGFDKLERAITLDPDNPILHWTMGYGYALQGRIADAKLHAQWMQPRVPTMPYTIHLASLIDAIEGRSDAARSAIGAIIDMPFDGHITFHLSETLAMAGDSTAALQLLERAIEHGFYPHDFIATHCPFLRPLRGSAEFQRIVAKAAQRVAEFSA